MAVAPGLYRFGRWQLDIQRCVLCADGKPVQLHTRAFEMLALLVSKHGEVVSRDEIVAHVWKGLVVGENNLTVQMSTLRRVLGDNDDGAPLIVTVPGRGYRFAGEVVDEAAIGSLEPETAATIASSQTALPPQQISRAGLINLRSSRTAVGFGLLAAMLATSGVAYMVRRPVPIAPRLSIAVLPFRNLSSDHTQDYLADALTDDLTTDLAHIPRAIVIARESSDVWRSQAAPIQDISRALHVRYVVEGSIRAEDGLLHVNAQLIDASNGAHVWASRIDGLQRKIGDIPEEIVRRLATALDFQLIQAENVRSLQDRSGNIDALDLFFQARAILDRDNSLAGLTRAQALLERAVAKQPDFSDALAVLGNMLLTKVGSMDDPEEINDYSEAHRVIEQALSMTPRNGPALAAQARSFAEDGRWLEAKYSAAAALNIEPSNLAAEAVLADCARVEGKLDEAATHLQNILRLAPVGPESNSRYMTLGYIELLRGNADSALDSLRQATAWDVKTSAVPDTMGRVEVSHLLMIAATALKGDRAQAQELYRQYSEKWQNRTIWRFAGYFDRTMSLLPGTARILEGLRVAGMPLKADEYVHQRYDVITCEEGDFTPTPTNLPGVETLDTKHLQLLVGEPSPPLVVDLGRGVAVPSHSLWRDPNSEESPINFVTETALHARSLDRHANIIVMGDGPFGCIAYRAARSLVAYGFTHISWYRGGEEAWAGAGNVYEDRRR